MNGDKWLRIAVLRIFRGLLVLRHFSFVGDIFVSLLLLFFFPGTLTIISMHDRPKHQVLKACFEYSLVINREG